MFEGQGPATDQTLPKAPPLAGTQPSGNYVKDACVLAVRAADRGDPANARKALKEALVQLDQIGDPAVYQYWLSQVQATQAYVEAKAGDAQALQVASQLQDDQYKLGQSLTPDERNALVNDNVDTQNAIDAKARGESADWAYNKRIVKEGAVKAIGDVSGAAASGASAAIGPWKWALLVGALLLAAAGLGYGYVLTKTAGAAGGAAS